jgi:Tol biopolymer transport system component
MNRLKTWLATMLCAAMCLWLTALGITSSTAYSQESAQIVVRGRSSIQIVEIDQGLIKNVPSTRSGDEDPICLPNGKGIVFVRYTKYGRDAARELFIVDQQQKQPTQLTFEMNAKMPSAAPDGERLAYVSHKTKQVYVVRIDTRQTTQLTTTFGGVGPWAPVWSPDRRRLALAYFEKDSYRTSFHVLDTRTQQLITISTPPAWAPNAWSPWSRDGTKLALGGMSRTIIVDISTGQPRIIRDFPGLVEDLQWSPDGTRLAFTQGEEGKYCDDVYVMDLQSGVRKRVSPWFLEYRCFHGPRWSPDSTKLAFLGYSSRGDMNPFPWPIHISDQV